MDRPHYDVVIATPGEMLHAEYVRSLVKTTEELHRRGLTYTFLNKYSSFVPTARELTAIDRWDHNYDSNVIAEGKFSYGKIFWIDSDIEWEPAQFMCLFDSELDIVSGLYALDPAGQVAVHYPDAQGVPKRVNKVEFLLHTEPVEVGGVGFGFVCMKSGVFEKITRPWFAIARLPWGETGLKVNVGEDYSWCANAQRHGLKIFVDPTIRVRHHKSTVYEV